ncbi:MAG: flavohemoglobin expression-modulating QEGLA motif protein, partial [Gammaproteobacteria bacterium]|nr:flavohemoglobin expression-modulating QEGLA motif protein [Gammaproteobacteria bacterium]
MLTDYHQVIHELSERIVAAQKPIRILDALKWDDCIQAKFFEDKFKKLPQIDEEYYQR